MDLYIVMLLTELYQFQGYLQPLIDEFNFFLNQNLNNKFFCNALNIIEPFISAIWIVAHH